MTQTSDMFDQIQDVTRPPLIIAELSANHSGDLGRALEIIAACGEAGADALKLQTYTADTITLTGNVVLIRGEDVATGERLVMQLEAGRTVLDGGNGQVQMNISPNRPSGETDSADGTGDASN